MSKTLPQGVLYTWRLSKLKQLGYPSLFQLSKFCLIDKDVEIWQRNMLQFWHIIPRPVSSLGHQGWRRIFWEESKFFKLCPKVLNYAQHIFPGGQKFRRGGSSSLVTGLIIPNQGYRPAYSSTDWLHHNHHSPCAQSITWAIIQIWLMQTLRSDPALSCY